MDKQAVHTIRKQAVSNPKQKALSPLHDPGFSRQPTAPQHSASAPSTVVSIPIFAFGACLESRDSLCLPDLTAIYLLPPNDDQTRLASDALLNTGAVKLRE